MKKEKKKIKKKKIEINNKEYKDACKNIFKKN